MKILLVEDDEAQCQPLRDSLRQAKYQVEAVQDAAAGLLRAQRGDYALVLLCLCHSAAPPSAVCAAMRDRRVSRPLLVLAERDAVEERIRALECGADDCLARPYAVEELVARVRALVRRDRLNRSQPIRVGDLEVDVLASEARRGGRTLRLTPREYQLLEALAANAGRVLSKHVIQDRIWLDCACSPDTVKVHVAALRKKVDGGFAEKLIHTVPGEGYVLLRPE